jgi:putative lipoprotein
MGRRKKDAMPLVCSRLAILCLAVEAFLLAGCAAPQSSTVPPPVASPALQTYRCPDEFSFSVEAGRDTARLFLPGRTLRLPRAEAASGAKYQRGVVTFWAKGQQEALLDLEEATYKGCRRTEELTPWDQARQRGVDFRATGNGPGWQFDIERGRRITFVGDYGRKRVIVPAPARR